MLTLRESMPPGPMAIERTNWRAPDKIWTADLGMSRTWHESRILGREDVRP
jgi:hypothetical protein